MKRIYADNAATTCMSRVAIDAMLPCFDGIYGNPSSLHTVGQEAAEALQNARTRIAACIGGAGFMEYYVQRHGDLAAFSYSIMSACLLAAAGLVLLLRKLTQPVRRRR